MKEKELLGLIVIFILLLSVGYMGYYINKRNIQIAELESKQPNDVPLLVFQLDSWGENMYDDGEYIFTGFIMNYGNQEAKNVEVTCIIDDADGNRIKTYSENIGSVSSNKWEYKEFNVKKPSGIVEEDIIGSCIYTGSDNGFNLAQNLEDYKELV